MIKKLGAQLYTVRDFAKTPEQIADTLEKVAAMGYRSVQVSGIGQIDPEKLAALAAKNNLDIALTHTSEQRLLGGLDAVMAEHRLLGCDIVGLGAMPQRYRGNGAAGIERFISDFTPVADRLAAAGFTFAYHNHAFEFVKYDGVTAMDMIIEKMSCPGFAITFDTYWAQFAGIDPVDFIDKNGALIAALHLKDMIPNEDNTNRMAEVGNGNLDWRRIIAASERQRVKWYMVEQDVTPADPFDSLRQSIDYLKNNALSD